MSKERGDFILFKKNYVTPQCETNETALIRGNIFYSKIFVFIKHFVRNYRCKLHCCDVSASTFVFNNSDRS